METRIFIHSDIISSRSLCDELQGKMKGVQFHLQIKPKSRISGETAIVVASITGASTIISVLITNLIQIIKSKTEKKVSKIVIHGRTGRRIEFESDMPDEKVRELIQLSRDIDIEEIEII